MHVSVHVSSIYLFMAKENYFFPTSKKSNVNCWCLIYNVYLKYILKHRLNDIQNLISDYSIKKSLILNQLIKSIIIVYQIIKLKKLYFCWRLSIEIFGACKAIKNNMDSDYSLNYSSPVLSPFFHYLFHKNQNVSLIVIR